MLSKKRRIKTISNYSISLFTLRIDTRLCSICAYTFAMGVACPASRSQEISEQRAEVARLSRTTQWVSLRLDGSEAAEEIEELCTLEQNCINKKLFFGHFTHYLPRWLLLQKLKAWLRAFSWRRTHLSRLGYVSWPSWQHYLLQFMQWHIHAKCFSLSKELFSQWASILSQMGRFGPLVGT